jgi:FkbM family methyltransferase
MRKLVETAISLIGGMVRRAGYQLRPLAAGPITMRAALSHFAGRLPVSTVIDVGASNGCWTEQALGSWPDARFLLIEAQRHPHEPDLARLKSRHPRVDYVLAAAGNRVGTIHFEASGAFAGRASDQPLGANGIEVPVTTLDAEVARRTLPGPYLVKLDVHGYERAILEGAVRVLADTSLLVVEVYNFTLGEGALQFPEMCEHLRRLGFRPVAIVDPMYRPKDGVLWQFDCFFARGDRPEFQSQSYE